jgi:adenosylcobinamide-GDP ribazoletransferase
VVVTALRGALGFLSRLPVGSDAAAWRAFRATPVAFPLAGWVLGPLVALPLLVPIPAPTVALAFLAWLVVLTGVNHADGVADLGDAAAVHGDPAERRAVMQDTTVGVGGTLALGVGLIGLALAGLGLARLPLRPALALVVASEVSAKLAVAAQIGTGEPSHEGFGAEFAERAGPSALALPALVAAPVLLAGGWGPVVAWPPLGGLAVFAAVSTAVAIQWWAGRRLGGVGGDVFGATNDFARLAALHAGVVAWMLW